MDFECLICCQPEHQTFVTPACCGTPICLPCYSDISARVPSYVAGPVCPFCRMAFEVWDKDRLKARQGDILRRASAAALELNARSERVAHYEARIKYYQAELDSEKPSLASEQKMYEILVREAAKANCVDEVQGLIVSRASRMMPVERVVRLPAGRPPVQLGRPPVQLGRPPVIIRPPPPVIAPRRTTADVVAAVPPPIVAAAPPVPVNATLNTAVTKRCAGCATYMPEAELISIRARWPRTAGGPPAERRALMRCLGCYNRYC
jgi:hypothetical protein